MAYNYLFTAHAEKDFEYIMDYISVELRNPTAAQNLGRKLFEAIDNVCAFPQSGTPVVNSGIADSSVRRLVIDNYLLYYKPLKADNLLYILRIVYGQRKQNDIL